MLATSKFKWFGSIILAGIVLVLALTGGEWGTSYSANASVNVAPFIDNIVPSAVPAGSPTKLLVINGSNFGNVIDTRVRLMGTVDDQLFTPVTIGQGRITVNIPADLLDVPIVYSLTVVKDPSGTIPTIPIPPGTEISNPVPFTVYEPIYYYFPLLFR